MHLLYFFYRLYDLIKMNQRIIFCMEERQKLLKKHFFTTKSYDLFTFILVVKHILPRFHTIMTIFRKDLSDLFDNDATT